LARVGLALYALAPPRLIRAQEQEKEAPTSTVYGRVVFEGTNRPVRRAQIALINVEGIGRARALVALTNANGEFRVKHAPPGRYYPFVNVSGVMNPISFIPVEELDGNSVAFNREELRQYFEEIEVDGKSDKEVTVRARRGAAISGKITYADGDPAINVVVHVMRRVEGRLTKIFAGAVSGASSGARTDDRGMFRVAGLPPGEYVIGVSEMADHKDDDSSARREFAEYNISSLMGKPLLMTYYPSAARTADATAIKVDAGDEREDVDITIGYRELRSIAGVVRGRRDRRPVKNATVKIVRKDEDGEPAAYNDGRFDHLLPSAQTDEQGRWRLKDFPDGNYTIIVTPPTETEVSGATAAFMNSNFSANMNGGYTPPKLRKRYSPARRDVQLNGDVDELAIELNDGGRIAGTVLFESGKLPEYSYIYAMPGGPSRDERMLEGLPGAPIQNGEFMIDGLPSGKFYVKPGDVVARGAALYVKSINWRGRDLLREPVEVGEGSAIEGVRVVYASGAATLSARVMRPDKRPASRVFVHLVPLDMTGWSLYSDNLTCVTQGDGTCNVTGAPGEYFVVTLAGARLNGGVDVEGEVRRRAATAPRVTLRSGETTNFETVLADRN
jgi:hypothetical protein